MRVNNWISFGSIMTAIAIGVAIAVMLSDIATVKAGWCDARPACFRDWIGALSGWAAAGAAAVTVLSLYRQTEQQTLQTDFLLGNSEPTIDAIVHQKTPHKVVIRVVNWNRRPIILTQLRVPARELHLTIEQAKIWDRDNPSSTLQGRDIIADYFLPAIAMHGWKDRARGPCEVRLDLTATKAGTNSRHTGWMGETLEIEVAMAGEATARRTLVCHIAGSPV